MAVVNNRQSSYVNKNGIQESKQDSVDGSKKLVKQIMAKVMPFLKSCEEYEPDESLRINKAPAVKVNNGLAIAPDLRCITNSGKIFWIEVKDKCQRAYFRDTGADLHQVLGWYDINKECHEPVLMVFCDASFEECLPKEKQNDANFIAMYRPHWDKFSGRPYGNWLSVCLTEDETSYPKIFDEHTRDSQAYICYFDINKLLPLDEIWKDLVDQIESNTVPRVSNKFEIKMQEKSIRKIAKSVISTPEVVIDSTQFINFGKYKGKPWTEVEISYLDWIINNLDKPNIVELAKNELKKRGK
jgi:hypothetical protein